MRRSGGERRMSSIARKVSTTSRVSPEKPLKVVGEATLLYRPSRPLALLGITAAFGVPGGQTLPLYGAAAQSGRCHVVMRDERNAAERLGIPPGQVADYLALVGDAAGRAHLPSEDEQLELMEQRAEARR